MTLLWLSWKRTSFQSVSLRQIWITTISQKRRVASLAAALLLHLIAPPFLPRMPLASQPSRRDNASFPPPPPPPLLQDAKIDWLSRVIAETQEMAGVLEVKPGKIVAGLEAEFTNKWLVAMAKCARGDFKPASAPAPAPAPAPAAAAAPKKKEGSPQAPVPQKAVPLKPSAQQQLHEEPPPRAAPPPPSQDDDGQENAASAAAPPARAARLERPVTARRPPPAPRVGTSGADRPPPPPPAAAVVIIGDGVPLSHVTPRLPLSSHAFAGDVPDDGSDDDAASPHHSLHSAREVYGGMGDQGAVVADILRVSCTSSAWRWACG